MKAISFILKFRKMVFMVCCAATILCIWAGLAHLWTAWVLVSLVSLPALYHHAAIQCERNRGRCFEQMGRQIVHNTPDVTGREVPSNAAWQRAVKEINDKGHLHAYVDAWYDHPNDTIKLVFE